MKLHLLVTPKPISQSYIPTLNGLRAAAIIMVLMSHLRLSTEGLYYRIFNGDLGVNIFFVLSGFLITTLCLKEKIATGDLSLKKFYMRRVLRILPLAYFFLIVVILLNFIFNLQIPAFQFLGAAFFILNLSYFRSHDLKPAIGHFWSLATEEQFYILFPPLLKISLKWFCIAILFIVFLLPIFCLLQEQFSQINKGVLYAFTHILIKFQGIAVGCLFSIAIFRYNNIVDVSRTFKLIFNCLAIILIFALQFNFFYSIDAIFVNLLVSVLIAYIILSNLIPSKDFIFLFLNNKVVNYVGVLSYSIYIWQQLFTIHQPWEHSFLFGDAKLINVIALAVVAYCSYNFFELKFLKLKKKYQTVQTNAKSQKRT